MPTAIQLFNYVVALLYYTSTAISQVDPETGEYVRDSKGFCIPVGLNEPGELVSKFETSDILAPRYTDPKAISKKVSKVCMCHGCLLNLGW